MLLEVNPGEKDGSLAPRRGRRFWWREEKLRIVAESLGPRGLGASVCYGVRRHNVNANLVFTWRRLVRDSRLGGREADAFLAVTVMPDGMRPEPVPAARSERMEILYADGTL